MRLVIFGRSDRWSGLIRALHARDHHISFIEPDGDLHPVPGADIFPYSSWNDVHLRAEALLADADAAIVSSHCADAAQSSQLVLDSPTRVRCYYKLGGVPLSAKRIPEGGLGGFDLVLTDTGGSELANLKTQFGAKHVVPLYACADTSVDRPVEPADPFRADVCFLGNYTADRRATLESLLLEPARRRPDLRFLIGGHGYPAEFLELPNIANLEEVEPFRRAAFYCSSRLVLSVAAASAAEAGYCPPVALFEAAACGVPVVSDDWDGLDYFFEPAIEILVARTTGHMMDALAKSPAELASVGRAGRERVLRAHTCERRALELENILEAAVALPVEAGRQPQ